MRALARLLEDLGPAPSDDARIARLAEYFTEVPDPDRGWALAILRGLDILPRLGRARLRAMVSERVDGALLALSAEHTRDEAEALALAWPGDERLPGPRLGEIVERLAVGPVALGRRLGEFLDAMPGTQRRALIDILVRRPATRADAGLLRRALAAAGRRPMAGIERHWAAVEPPYRRFFAWLDGGAMPDLDPAISFCPMAWPVVLESGAAPPLEPRDAIAETNWSGLRVQFVGHRGRWRIYSGGGDDVTGAFSDLITGLPPEIAADGVIIPAPSSPDAVARRLAARRTTPRLRTAAPVSVRLVDLLRDGARDLRPLPLDARRAALEALIAGMHAGVFSVSPAHEFSEWVDLAATAGAHGLLIKRRGAPYDAAAADWFLWPKEPRAGRFVLMYAEPRAGSGDWVLTVAARATDGPVPVGRTVIRADDPALPEITAWVRKNSVERFGPVRSVWPGLVLEIAYDGIARARRRKAGLVLQRPRLAQVLADDPAETAIALEDLGGRVDP